MPGAREAVALVAVVAGVVVATSHHWFDSRLGAQKTASALEAQLHTRYEFRCTREEEDQSLPNMDVDYVCWTPRHDDGYWVGTNSERITDLLPMG